MFRVGATSYVIPDQILPNVEYLAPRVDDVELLLFESDEHGGNLPSAALVADLRQLAAEHDLTYTVHLPLDLSLGSAGSEGHASLLKARRVIEATNDLEPHAFTVHLDGRPLLASPSARELADWRDNSRRALQIVCSWLDDPRRLCVENVEGWDAEALAPIVDAVMVSRTIDVGHLWLQAVDPLDHLSRWIDRARVVHLHGVAKRDHASVAQVCPEMLDPVVALMAARFSGVVTLEVFNSTDLDTSIAALNASISRCSEGEMWPES